MQKLSAKLSKRVPKMTASFASLSINLWLYVYNFFSARSHYFAKFATNN